MNSALFSSAAALWATPQDLFDKLHREFHFEVDVCAIAENAKCPVYFTPEMDGLKQEWLSTLIVNKTGSICQCQKHSFNAPSAKNINLLQGSSSTQTNVRKADLPLNAKLAKEKGNVRTKRLKQVNWNAPVVRSLNPLHLSILLATLITEQDIPLGAENAVVNMLGLNRRADALILWSELLSLRPKRNMLNQKRGDSAVGATLTSKTIRDVSEILKRNGIGQQPTGKPVKPLGITAVHIAGNAENLRKITLSPYLLPTAPEQSVRIWFRRVPSAILQNKIGRHLNGARTKMYYEGYRVTSHHCPQCGECIEITYPSIAWMNPPYGSPEHVCKPNCKKKRCAKRGYHNTVYKPGIIDFMHKAYTSAKAGATVVCLVPARTDTKWWWSYAIHGEVRFLKGRLKFGDGKKNAPFPSAIIIFHPGLANQGVKWGL